MTSLPPDLPEASWAIPGCLSAYKTCLRVECVLVTEQSNDGTEKKEAEARQLETHLVYIRILGYLLHFVPSRAGLDCLAREIEECATDHDLVQLGQRYYDQFLRPFRFDRNKDKTSMSPDSPPSFDTLDEMIDDALELVPESYATAKKKALARDNFRCAVSGIYDLAAFKQSVELRNEFYALDPGDRPGIFFHAVYSRCTHVFPECVDEKSPDCGQAAIWEVMERLGYGHIQDELSGAKIHRLENVMTVEYDVLAFFESLDLWFVVTGKPNEYRIKTAKFEGMPYDADSIFTLKTSRPELPVTSLVYLAIHAACAQVAYLSGALELMEKYEREMEEGLVLSPSGDSAALLDHALRELKVAGY